MTHHPARALPRHALTLLAALLLACLQAFTVAPALAAGGLTAPALDDEEEDFLPVREAFRFTLERDDHAFYARWEIADDYYLYRDKLRFQLLDEAGNSLAWLGAPQMPSGKEKQDEIFGLVEVYFHALRVRLPFTVAPTLGEATLRVTYQGCAEGGFCYAPETEEWPAELNGMSVLTGAEADAAARAATAGGSSNGSGKKPAANDAGALAGFLADASFPLIILTFLLLGLGLAFTPCVLPMVPILSSIVVGEGAGISTRRAFTLSLAYVLGMAFTYTLAGIAIGLLGAAFNLTLWLQSPPVLIVFAVIFVLLSLSMFGFYELQLPAALRDRLSARPQAGGKLLPVAIMGALSALVVSPCVSAPLAGILMFIGSTGDALLGGVALFALALGMGLPLLLIGTSGGQLLPRAGAWMNGVKAAFGVLLLGVAITLLERILPGPVTLGLWALLAIGSAVYLGALEPVPAGASGWRFFRKATGIALLGWGLAMGAGAAAGGGDPLRPLAPFTGGTGSAATATANAHDLFTRVPDATALEQALAEARAAGRPVMLDFYADWCVACRIMARDVFPQPAVQAALAGYTLLQVDVTASTKANSDLLAAWNVPGLPAILFFRPDGSEVADQRILGELDEAAFLAWVRTRIDPNLQGSR